MAINEMPDLHITFEALKEHEGSEVELVTYTVSPDNFLFEDVNQCHIGIVNLEESSEYIVLGPVFMENFYVTFDATEYYHYLRVGISNKPVPKN